MAYTTPINSNFLKNLSLFGVALFSLHVFKQNYQYSFYYNDNIKKTIEVYKNIPPKKTILTDIWIFSFLENDLISTKKNINHLNCFDNGYFSLFDAYWENKPFKNTKEQMDYLLKNKSNVLLYASKERTSLWEEYFNSIYGKKILFQQVSDSPEYKVLLGGCPVNIYLFKLESYD